MIFSYLRDKFFSFVLPVIVVAGMVGSSVWFFVTAYFWDISRLTLLLPTGEKMSVKITTQVRIVYTDFVIFGTPYAFHFTLPWSQEKICQERCTFDWIPSGFSSVVYFSEASGVQSNSLLIQADTDGTLDLRPTLTISPDIDEKILSSLRSKPLSEKEQAFLSGKISFSNTFEGVYLFSDKGKNYVYDSQTQQTFILPVSFEGEKVGRYSEDGVYIFYTDNSSMLIYDRYGRQSQIHTQKITHGSW